MSEKIAWSSGEWLTKPLSWEEIDGKLHVEAVEGSDFWQKTMYGFQRDSGHSLLAPWNADKAIEVGFRLDGMDHLYDQAGLMLWSHSEQWIKAGIEMNDGIPHVGAVVTSGLSDWSLSPVPEWAGEVVTIRASRLEDAVIVRARTERHPWRTIRVSPLPSREDWQAGPFLCAPTSGGLKVAFTRWVLAEPDTDVHVEPVED
ncbi:DUF1349 domain-containing protein [Paenibacillus humicus]|uniref:DUF1349 domain-containing protein n=1 Tax=Paenibacillus humicus TaxID=412861 RepID=UPI003F18BC3D